VECICCMEDFTADRPPLFLPCHRDHQMHERCISQWEEACSREQRVVSCPLCRRAFSLTEVTDHLGTRLSLSARAQAEEARGGVHALRCDHRDESGNRCPVRQSARSELFECPGCDQSFCVDHLTECDICGEEYCASECIRTCVSCERPCCFECCDADTEGHVTLWRCSECVEAERKKKRKQNQLHGAPAAAAAAGPVPRASSVADSAKGQRIDAAASGGAGFVHRCPDGAGEVKMCCAGCRKYFKADGLAACHRCRSRLCLASCLRTCVACKISHCSGCWDSGWEAAAAATNGATSKWKCSQCVRKNEDTQQRLDRQHRVWLAAVAQRREKAAAKKQQEAVRRKKQTEHDQLLAQVREHTGQETRQALGLTDSCRMVCLCSYVVTGARAN
jgi:hypothetical protein